MKVLIVGDSYAFGHGCDDRIRYFDNKKKQWVGQPDVECWNGIPSEFSYGSLLQKEFPKHTVINKSFPGADNMNIFVKLLENIHDCDLVFYNATTHNRMQCATSPPSEESRPWIIGQHEQSDVTSIKNHEYLQAHRYYLKYLYHEDWYINMSLSGLYGGYGSAKAKNKKFYWSVPFYTANYFSELDRWSHKLFHYLTPITHCRYESLNSFAFPGYDGKQESTSEYLAPDKHANNLGHQYFYENVIRPIFLRELR